MRRKITATTLPKLKPGPEFGDVECPGLRVKVRASGRISFSLRYRVPATGRGNKLTLGYFTDQDVDDAEPVVGGPLSLAQARLLCVQAKHAIARGTNPSEAKQHRKAELRRQGRDTFLVVAKEYVERHALRNLRRGKASAQGLGFTVNKDGTLADELREGSLVQRWKDKPIMSITKRDVRELTDERIDRGVPYSALSVFKQIRRVLNFAVERDYIPHSPLAKVKPPHRAEARDRILTVEEIRLLWRACDALDYPWGPLVKLLLALGQRRDEIRKLSVEELNADTSLITLPASRVKNKHEHLVPISTLARKVLEQCPRLGNPWVFTIDGKNPCGSISKATNKLRKLMLAELRRDTPDADLADFRLHDLRRTCATMMGALKVPPHVIDAVQNHISGTIRGVSRTYNRWQYLDEKRDALELWGEELRRITTQG